MYLEEFDRLVKIMKRLRKECPWDREQTPESLRQYILEEAYETIEMIDLQNWKELKKELGDLLLQIIFQSEIAEERNHFQLGEVIQSINDKLVERHPHVFGDASVQNAREVKDNWEQIKVRTEQRRSVLEGIPRHQPALLRAQRVQDKASQVNFDWENPAEIVAKIREEIDEWEKAADDRQRQEELGDLLFSVVNLCRFEGYSAEDLLRATTEKFIRRFQYVENELRKKNSPLRETSLDEMEKLWQEAKSQEKP